MARFVPELRHKGAHQDVQRLLGNLLAIRTLTGIVGGFVYFLLVRRWFDDLPTLLIFIVALAVSLRSLANVPFAYFLGLNRAARWGLGDVARQWGSLLFMLVLTALAGLPGAVTAVLASEALVLCLGLYWLKGHIQLKQVRIDRAFIRPFLRFNATFLASNLLLAFCLRIGETLVKSATVDYREVGYFGMAMAGYLAAANATWQIFLSFLPVLSHFWATGRQAAARERVGGLAGLLAAAGVVTLVVLVVFGRDIVLLVAGNRFAPVARLLVPIGIAILLNTAASAFRLLSLVQNRPLVALVSALFQAVTLMGGGYLLVSRLASLGMTVAVAAAALMQTVAAGWAFRDDAGHWPRRWLAIVALGGLFAPLTWILNQGLVARVPTFLLCLAGYATALHVFGLVTLSRVAVLWRGEGIGT